MCVTGIHVSGVCMGGVSVSSAHLTGVHKAGLMGLLISPPVLVESFFVSSLVRR